jgi:hypothetical protein
MTPAKLAHTCLTPPQKRLCVSSEISDGGGA